MRMIKKIFLFIYVSVLFSMCKTNSNSELQSTTTLPADSVKASGSVLASDVVYEEMKLDSSFVMKHTWLKLDRDEEGYFFIPLEPCDNTEKSFNTTRYYVNAIDSTLVDSEVTSAWRHKIVGVKCSNKDNLDFKLEIKTDGPDTFPFSVIVEPIDDLHPERKICRFLQVNTNNSLDTLGLFISDVLADKVNHKRVEECLPH